MKKVMIILMVAALGSGIAAFAANPPKKAVEPRPGAPRTPA